MRYSLWKIHNLTHASRQFKIDIFKNNEYMRGKYIKNLHLKSHITECERVT